MGMELISNLNANQNQIQNAAIHNLSSAPSNPVKGQQYFSTVNNTLYIYNGTEWVSSISNITSGSTADVLVITKNGTTNTITINNVENATKASQDSNGNNIVSTYATKSEIPEDVSTNKINGIPLTTVDGHFFGTSDTAAATVEKVVSIPSITSLTTGQVIYVKPSITSTVANSTLKLNSFDAYPMRYNNAAITTSTDSIVWSANIVSCFIFDGIYWQFAGKGLDSNTTYSAMSVAEGTTGTATTSRVVRADYLKQIISGTVLTGLDTTTATSITDTDTILSGFGKLQAQINNAGSSQSGTFSVSNWASSNGKYILTVSVTGTTSTANIIFYDSNNEQVFPESVLLTKSGNNITSITAIIGSDPDCRFEGTYNIFY